MRFSKKCKKNFKSMQLTPNFKINTRLKQETQNIFDFYDFLIFLYFYYFLFSKKFLEKRKRKKKNFLKKFLKRKLPNLSNKMNRQLSILEQSPATAPKTWWTKLWSLFFVLVWIYSIIVFIWIHNSVQLTSKCTGSSK